MSQATPGEPSFAGHRVGRLSSVWYPIPEWRLLTRLPVRVVVTATSFGPYRRGPDVRIGLAGLDGIAAGWASDSELVRAVTAAIYRESEDHPPLAAWRVPSLGPVGVLAECRWAVRVLAGRSDPADSAAYRQWVQSVAARVCRAGAGQNGPSQDNVLRVSGSSPVAADPAAVDSVAADGAADPAAVDSVTAGRAVDHAAADPAAARSAFLVDLGVALGLG